MPNKDYPWDPYSDQPHILKDKKFKRHLYIKGLWSSIKTFLYIPVLPLIALRILFSSKKQTYNAVSNIGLCVNVSKPTEKQTHQTNDELAALVNELGVKDLLIRIPLSDIENLDNYHDLAKKLSDKCILINILQDRDHIEDPTLLKSDLRTVFSRFRDISNVFQIANSINRKKWGFVTTNEYFDFFKTAQTLRDTEFTELKLLGGNTIDFELPNFARSVLHAAKIKYDGVAAQLYVDRRGAPENSQFGFDLTAKIHWFYELITLSKKTDDKLYITETNWPLIDTVPYAPAKGDCLVDEDRQAAYLVRYYLLMIATGKVEKCYWHQLIAPGYGLIDNRASELRKHKAFDYLKTLNTLLYGATPIRFEKHTSYYSFEFRNNNGTVIAIWSNNNETKLTVDSTKEIISANGQLIVPEYVNESRDIKISGTPTYMIDYKYQ